MRHAPADLTVALAHHWLTGMRGGEKVLRRLLPYASGRPVVFTLISKPGALDAALRDADIRTSWLQRFRFIPNVQRKALPVLHRAARSLDATRFDVVICSDAATIKAVRTRPDAMKICYCHSPMRYVWDQYEDYYRQAGAMGRLGLRLFARRVRAADRAAARGVTAFIANSRHVADRIRRCYGRASVVIPPPVETGFPPNDLEPDDFYLVVGEHVAYKRHDLAVAACSQLGRRLVVIGRGTDSSDLRCLAGPTVTLLGWQPTDVIRDHMRRCRALLFCGEEDFGLVPVEAQAAGRPVVAYGRGGALETVRDGCSGVCFDQQTVDDATSAIERFENTRLSWSSRQIQEHAVQFSEEAFDGRFARFFDWCVEAYRAGGVEAVRRKLEADPAEIDAIIM